MRRTALLLLALAPFGSGCVAVAAAGVVGVGVVQYHRNEASQDFSSPLETTWQAALDGLRRLKITPEESVLGVTEGHLTEGGLHVLIERHPEGFTRVRVRVNTFRTADNQRRARLVLQEIESALESKDELRAWIEKGQGSVKGERPKP